MSPKHDDTDELDAVKMELIETRLRGYFDTRMAEFRGELRAEMTGLKVRLSIWAAVGSGIGGILGAMTMVGIAIAIKLL